jgi:hypothetical protein
VVTYHLGQPFSFNGNARVDTYMGVLPGGLTVTNVLAPGAFFVTVQFNNRLNSSTVTAADIQMIASVDSDFSTLGDNTDITGFMMLPLLYPSPSSIEIRMSSNWTVLGVGTYFQLTLSGTIADSRGNLLDGEYTGTFPSGDGTPGGVFVYEFTYP